MITIVIPVYNVEEYINKCLDSVCSQTVDDFKVILVDDGSTDRSGEICDFYKEKDSRFTVIHKKNGGLSDARNVGIANVTSEYVLPLDSDDYIESRTIEKLISVIFEYPDADIVQFKRRELYPDEIKESDDSDELVCFERDEALRMYFSQKYFTHAAWDKLYKTKLFRSVQYPKGRIAEDLATTYRLFCESKRIIFLNQTLHNYVIRSNSIMSTSSDKLLRETFIAVKEIKAAISKMCVISDEMLCNYIFNTIEGVAFKAQQKNTKEMDILYKDIIAWLNEEIVRNTNIKKIIKLKLLSHAPLIYKRVFRKNKRR